MTRNATGASTGVVALDLPDHSSVAFDAIAYDEAIAAHGVEFEHEIAMPDPVGLVSKDDDRRPGPGAKRSSNNRIYVPAGCFRAIMTGNSKELRAAEQGAIDASQASMTPTRFYCSEPGKRVRLHPNDRLYLRDCSVLVTQHQLVDSSATGRDRLRFPAQCVEALVDSLGVPHKAGVSFDLVSGDVVWRPGVARGPVYSVRYTYRPHWYVDRLLHDVRVAQVVDLDGEPGSVQLNQAAIVQREYAYRAEAPDPQAPPSDDQPRAAAAPPDGQFGAR